MEGKARSVFVMVQCLLGPSRFALYEIKIKQGGEVMEPMDVPLDPVFEFFDQSKFKVPKYYCLEGARFGSKLYLLLNEGISMGDGPANPGQNHPYSGYIFDTNTRSLDTFEPPLASKPVSSVMSAYGKLYNLASPLCFSEMPKILFECYDPNNHTWQSLPDFEYTPETARMKITGCAVCYDCILVSICRGYFGFLVFNIERGTWHQVNISTSEAFYSAFRGRAVVVDDTIYALSVQCGKVIAFSLSMEMEDNGDIFYSLGKPFFLPGLENRVGEDRRDLDCREVWKPTEYLVHLGKLEFCLIQTAPTGFENESQELFVTTFQIVLDGEMHIKTLDSSICDLHTQKYRRVYVYYSFTPDCEDHEPGKKGDFSVGQEKG